MYGDKRLREPKKAYTALCVRYPAFIKPAALIVITVLWQCASSGNSILWMCVWNIQIQSLDISKKLLRNKLLATWTTLRYEMMIW